MLIIFRWRWTTPTCPGPPTPSWIWRYTPRIKHPQDGGAEEQSYTMRYLEYKGKVDHVDLTNPLHIEEQIG